MSVGGQIDSETELYCSPSDVARFIRPREEPSEGPTSGEVTVDEYSDYTHPSREEVIKHIEGASVRFERKTQQAFRANTVTEETHDHGGLYYWLSGHPIQLMKKNVRPIDESKGDKIEVWNGNDWEEWASDTSLSYGRDEDYWVDGPNGLLWVYERAILRPHPKFRITYRYGYDMVPADVREAVAKRAAADIISGDFYGTIVPGNNQGDNADPSFFVGEWKDDFKEVARDYKKVSFI